MKKRVELHKRTVYRILVFSLLICFVLVTFLLSLRCGSLKLSFTEIFRAIFSDKNGINHQIIRNIRLPRNIVASLVGICLSLSGTILQGVMRNPLAAPNIIGVSSGGGLAAIMVMIALPEYIYLLVPAAFSGALAATLIIYLLAWKHGAQPMRLVLAGIAVSSLMGACMSALMLFFPDRVAGTLNFMIGGLSTRSWHHVNIIWPYALAGSVLAFGTAKRLNIMVLGDETAISLGINIEISRVLLIAVSALLAAASVSVVGLLGFVGLVVPHMMRLLIGSDHRVLFPACILFSSGLMLLCDTFGRIIMDPVELPVGIIMAFIGAPFFLYILRKKDAYANNS